MSDEDHNRGLKGKETLVEIEEVQTSTSQSQANPSHNEVVLNIEEEKLLTEIGQQRTETETGRSIPNKYNSDEIKKIREIMEKNYELYYYFYPTTWKIGPIISGCYSLPRGQQYKLAAHFISENGNRKEYIFEDFKKNWGGIKEYFGEDIISKFGEEGLMRLLFLDGCAMLGFIHCYVRQRLKVVGISDAQAAKMVQDLLLLENQIPFQVLEVLIGSGINGHRSRFILELFIYLICRGTFPGHSPEGLFKHLEDYCFSPEGIKNQKAVHLLDVFREALLFTPPSFDPFEYMLTLIRGAFWILCSCGCLAISYFLERFKPEPDYNMISNFGTAKEFFFSVQELKAAGIKFKPSHSLKTVSFRSLFYFRPQLMLPTLIVDDSTASKLVSLVAYEMNLSDDHPNKGPCVTSYVNLLDSLVDNEQDIKDLRAADILRNTLSTDTRAAELINKVGTGCIAPTKDAYEGVKEKIKKYYRRKCAVWMAEVCSTHFSSPWTILALFAATAVLLLTAFQTWYAVNPKK